MSRRLVRVDELLIDESIEEKLRGKKPPLTGAEVREVVLWSADAVPKWHLHPVYGWRLSVRGKTFQGRPIIAYLKPLDRSARIFELKTAWVENV